MSEPNAQLWAVIESLISENKSLRNRLTQRQLDDSLNNDDWGDDSDHA